MDNTDQRSQFEEKHDNERKLSRRVLTCSRKTRTYGIYYSFPSVVKSKQTDKGAFVFRLEPGIETGRL